MKKSEKEKKTLNAKLFVRILPSTDFNCDLIKMDTNKKVIYVRCLQDLSKGVNLKKPNYWCFCTDGIFWNSCQTEVYETVMYGLYDELFSGVRAMILSYGQSGSGKSFTTSGLRFSFQNRGLILRILSQLFEEKEGRRDSTRITIGMSYIEFNAHNIKDLIGNKFLSSTKEIEEYQILSETWAWKQLFNAEMKKSFSHAAPYKGSNKGHSVLTFYIHSESLIDTEPVITHSKILIVDMSGIDYFGNEPSIWREKFDVGSANLSKSLMEQLIICMTRDSWKNANRVCSYKSSRFLSYLHDTFNSKCLLRFIAHVIGNTESLPLTLSTLKFGESIRSLKPMKLEITYESNYERQVRNLEKEFLRLKDEAELTAMLRDSPDYSNVSRERLNEMKRAAEAYLLGQMKSLTLFSLGQATLSLEVFRELYFRLSAEKDQIMKEAIAAATELMQCQASMERSGVSQNNSGSNSQRISRKKSRQMDSQSSYGTSYRSSDPFGIAMKTPSGFQQVGETDRKGIAIGPGKTDGTFEGNITKAFKKLKSKKSDSVTVKGAKPPATKELGISSSKNQVLDTKSNISFVQNIPSRDSAWHNFFNEKTELANALRSSVETAEAKAKEAKRKYDETLKELAAVREKLEESNLEFENCRHVRQIHGEGEENPVREDIENIISETVARKDELVNEAVEKCHVALIDLRNAGEEVAEAKRAFEESFQEFCQEHYRTAFASEAADLFESTEDEFEKGVALDASLRNQSKAELYSRLQEKLLNYVSKSPTSVKKEWVSLF